MKQQTDKKSETVSEGNVRESWVREPDDIQCIKCGFVTKSIEEYDTHSPCKTIRKESQIIGDPERMLLFIDKSPYPAPHGWAGLTKDEAKVWILKGATIDIRSRLKSVDEVVE